MKNLKILGISATALLLLLALIMSYLSVKHLGNILPADSYEDKGVYTFVPYQVLPLQMKNNSAYNRDRRMNPKKTIFVIYYKATDGSGYTWNKLATDREQGTETIKNSIPVSRRVLTISADNTYITVEQQENAKSYTAKLRQKYTITLTLAVIYILLYIVVWIIIIIKGK